MIGAAVSMGYDVSDDLSFSQGKSSVTERPAVVATTLQSMNG